MPYCEYGAECFCLKGMQNSVLQGIWMNMLRAANELPPKPVFGFMGCKYFHEKNTIPCVHAMRADHDITTCKFDHSYYRAPTDEENATLKQHFEKSRAHANTNPHPVGMARPAASTRPAAMARPHQKVDANPPPFLAPPGKYWEQTKSGWTLKFIPRK